MTKLKRTDRSYYPSLRGTFGDWTYYSCLMPAKDVTARVSFSDEIHPNKALSSLIQRTLKAGRAKEIGDYLLREPQRFFNSMVVAVYGGEPVWHGFSNFRPQFDDIDLSDVPEDAEDSVGFLSFTGEEKLWALDGQHRLAGIRNALGRNPELQTDDVSMLLVAHSNNKDGLKRTRQLFTTLNKTARPVGKGEIIALDENDTMAIVSRHLFDFDPHFSEERIKFAQSDNVSTTDAELTTIGNLYDVLYAIFSKYPKPRVKQDLRFIRPSDDEIEGYIALAKAFFSGLGNHFEPLGAFFKAPKGKSAGVVHRFRTPSGGHVLFRPIGLKIFAEVAAVLLHRGNNLADTLSRVAELPTDLSSSPYANVIWKNGKVVAGGRALARDLLLYMLGLKGEAGLRDRVARARGVEADTVKLPRRL